DERERERPDEVFERPLEFASAAQNACLEAQWNADFIGRVAEGRNAVGQRIAGAAFGPNGPHRLAVEPIDPGGRLALVERDDVVDPRENASGRWRAGAGAHFWAGRGEHIKLRD